MTFRITLLTAWLALTGCDNSKHVSAAPDSGSSGSTTSAGANSKSASGPTLGTPEPWTLGAVRDHDGLALPPPCSARRETLRGVLARETRIAAAPSTGGVLLVGEGSVRPAFALDAAGLMTMTHGRATVRGVPWPAGQRPLLARGEKRRWLLALDNPPRQGADAQLFLWRDGEREHLANKAHAADLRCHGSVCALLTTPIDHRTDAATLLVGRADEAALSWQRVRIEASTPRSGERSSGRVAPFGIERISGEGSTWQVVLSLVDDWRVRFFEANSDDELKPLAALEAPHGVLDALATPTPIAMLRATAADPRSCVPDGGGVVIAREGKSPLPLRATSPPLSGSLHALNHGALAVWTGRARCESRRRVLYAAMLQPDGTPVGTVTTVADADEYALASHGDDVDLWVRNGRQITWARARCRRR